MLVKVKTEAATRSHVLGTVDLFQARVVDVSSDSVTIEALGRVELEALLGLLGPYGVKEIVQSELVAIGRGPRSITDRALRHPTFDGTEIRRTDIRGH